MAETPKTREDLIDTISRLRSGNCASEDFLEAIESLGLRIVPAEATNAMENAMFDILPAVAGHEDNVYRAAVAASPFAQPENPNG